VPNPTGSATRTIQMRQSTSAPSPKQRRSLSTPPGDALSFTAQDAGIPPFGRWNGNEWILVRSNPFARPGFVCPGRRPLPYMFLDCHRGRVYFIQLLELFHIINYDTEPGQAQWVVVEQLSNDEVIIEKYRGQSYIGVVQVLKPYEWRARTNASLAVLTS